MCRQRWGYWFEFGPGQEWLNVIVIILSLGNINIKGKAPTQGVVWALIFGWLWVMGYAPKCAEQRSPQGTWYCCLPTHGHCWERPSTNPVEIHLLCCFWHQAEQGRVSGAGWDGPHPQYCPCSSPAVLAEVLKLLDFSPVLGRSLRINYKATKKKIPGLQTCPARNGFLLWTNKHVLLTRWR